MNKFENVIRAIRFAQERYTEEDFKHCLRVCEYAIKATANTDCAIAAVLHDILEDTKTTSEELANEFSPKVVTAVELLTKDSSTPYEDYIAKIFESKNFIAINVKRADMKDHLTQTETLSDKLKAKYLSVMHYFI